jgi:hypothetical protein
MKKKNKISPLRNEEDEFKFKNNQRTLIFSNSPVYTMHVIYYLLSSFFFIIIVLLELQMYLSFYIHRELGYNTHVKKNGV